MIAAFLLAAMPAQDVLRGPMNAEDEDALRRGAQSCGPAAEEITVCGDPGRQGFRLAPLDDARFQPQPLRPAFRTPGGGRGMVRAVQRSTGGVSVPAAVVTVKIPLGGKPRKKK